MPGYEDLNKNLIGGTWCDGRSTTDVADVNPFTGETILSFRAAGVEDIDLAYRTAAQRQPEWAATNPYEVSAIIARAAQILQERAPEAVDWLVRESGSTLLKSEIEVGSCVGVMNVAAGYPFQMEETVARSLIPDKVNHTIRKPVGVVGVIGPFNFPMFLAMRSVAPALAAGNAVVLKPATTTAVTGGTLIAKIFEEAGLPPGLLQVLVSKGSEIGDAFYEHPVPDAISFTGSTEVGARIGQVAGGRLKKTMLELGGNNAVVVLDDADVDYAVRAAAFGRFLHSGQICMSANRIVVDESLYEGFVGKFVDVTSAIKVGDPAEPGTLIGPLITEWEAERVVNWVDKARAEGAEVVLEGGRDGALVRPYVLKADNDTWTARNEVFGPVANIISAKDEADALRIANDTEAGLSGAVHTSDPRRGFTFAAGWKTGMVHINDQSVNDEPQIAFGGEKSSGIGRFGRNLTLDEVTTYQWVSDQRAPRAYPL